MIELEMENLKKHHANLLLSQKINIDGKLDKEVMAGSPQFQQNRQKAKDSQLNGFQDLTVVDDGEILSNSNSCGSGGESDFEKNIDRRRSAICFKSQSANNSPGKDVQSLDQLI